MVFVGIMLEAREERKAFAQCRDFEQECFTGISFSGDQ
jgi:hypothetical protein